MGLFNKTAQVENAPSLDELKAKSAAKFSDLGGRTTTAQDMTAHELDDLNSMSVRQNDLGRRSEFTANLEMAGQQPSAELQFNSQGDIEVGDALGTFSSSFAEAKAQVEQEAPDFANNEPSQEIGRDDIWSEFDDR